MITLLYNFDDYYVEGGDAIHVKCNNFKYDVKLKEEDSKLSLDELTSKYRRAALIRAAFNQIDF